MRFMLRPRCMAFCLIFLVSSPVSNVSTSCFAANHQLCPLNFELSIYHQVFNLLPKWISFVQCTVQKQLGLRTVMR